MAGLWQIALVQHVTQIDIPATIPIFLLELHELMPQRSSAAHGALLLIEGNDVPTGVTRSKHRRISLEAL